MLPGRAGQAGLRGNITPPQSERRAESSGRDSRHQSQCAIKGCGNQVSVPRVEWGEIENMRNERHQTLE